ncbi:MAG: AAA domain-containing protein, partial [Gemmatimonadales bacterium]
ARDGRGVVIYGPPGTGKSQVIVNLVADALARGEKVLVVCQKRAAIDVVFDRLRAVGLERCCVVVHDSEADRRATILALRADLDAPARVDESLLRERTQLAAEITRIEQALDAYHAALVEPVPARGATPRRLFAEHAAEIHRAGGPPVPLGPASLWDPFSRDDLDRLLFELEPIAHLWERTRPLTNPWVHRRPAFRPDPASRPFLRAALEATLQLASQMQAFLGARGPGADVRHLPPDAAQQLPAWGTRVGRLAHPSWQPFAAAWLRRWDTLTSADLDMAAAALRGAAALPATLDAPVPLATTLAQRSFAQLKQLAARCAEVTDPITGLALGRRWRRRIVRRGLRKLLKTLPGIDPDLPFEVLAAATQAAIALHHLRTYCRLLEDPAIAPKEAEPSTLRRFAAEHWQLFEDLRWLTGT